MATIRIDQAKHGELLAFIKGQLNLEVPDHSTRAQLVDIIRTSGYQPKVFTLDADDLRPAGSVPRAAVKGDYTHVKLTIAPQEGTGGAEPVFVSHNGVPIFIPRGEPVLVKRKFFEALMHAEVVLYPEKDRHPVGESALMDPIIMPRFPITPHEFLTLANADA